MSQANVAAVRAMWEAFLRSDFETALAAFDPDVEHISLTDPSACVERAVTSYLVALVAPRRATVCQSDHQPSDPKFGEPLPGGPPG